MFTLTRHSQTHTHIHTHTHTLHGWCRMGWNSEGIKVVNVMTKDGVTTVQCSSTHLASFAVLVGVGGGLEVVFSHILYMHGLSTPYDWRCYIL